GGQLLHLQGDNGAGKSSLLLALAGILPPTQGDIHWRGQDVQQDLLAYQQQVCFLGHRTGVCQDLTVLQQLQLYGFSKAEAWAFLRAQGMA
ncbi:ATP-binding cassette domain-containing protein, partial [Microbacterium sp. ZXX196]|uniref:ABC transporter ATP-binding protein n=1 Tax=Microbacterium sp. ZXX196 TaxID=2609291 RepID=UPI0012B88754